MLFSHELMEALKAGEIAIIPTDTLYGIVCSARAPDTVEKLYVMRHRDEHKPCVILIDDIARVQEFGVVITDANRQALSLIWPGKVSVIFDCPENKWEYLHRGKKTLAFRVPDDPELCTLLRNTGPLVAPSANREGLPPAHTIAEARKYFTDQDIIYVDGGYRDSLPSTVARLYDGVWVTLRAGAVKLDAGF